MPGWHPLQEEAEQDIAQASAARTAKKMDIAHDVPDKPGIGDKGWDQDGSVEQHKGMSGHTSGRGSGIFVIG